jgi:hypothetical protein
MVAVKIIAMLSLMTVAYQDIKERSVYWFVFPIIAFAFGYLYFINTFFAFFWRTILVNLGIVTLVLLILHAYTKFKLKTNLPSVFGLGDALLFFAICVAFPSVSFVIFFVFSLLFSLLLHFVLKTQTKVQSVPLAGYMSLFFIGIYLAYWSGVLTNIYSL